MKTLEFDIDISSDKRKVWDTMLQPDTYKQWVSDAWPDSTYEGQFKQGEEIRFISPGQGGTLATIDELRPLEYVHAEHIAVINPDGSEDRESETAKGWVGTEESYTFTGNNGNTHVKVEIKTNPAWEKMFADTWPRALEKLKEICEK